MIPYGRQDINEEDIAAVIEALRSDFLTTGPKVKEFENRLCEITGAKYAIACSNCTTALHLGGMALDVGEGDAIIVPSITFLATANAVRYCGAEVVFSDVDPESGLMRVSDLEKALERAKKQGLNVKAVYPVHLTGQCVDSKEIYEFAKSAGLKVQTDAAHAIGSKLHGIAAGSGIFEDVCSFSFHPVKTIAMGEGGAVTTNDPEIAAKIGNLRHHGMEATPEKGLWCYEMNDLGYNYRVTDFQCALGLSQMKRLDEFVGKRQKIVTLYDELLKPLAPVLRTPPRMQYCRPAWHLYSVKVDFAAAGITRNAMMSALRERGIGTQVHYIPVHTQPYYKNRSEPTELPGADAYYEQTLSIPLYPSLSEEEVRFISGEITKIISG